MDIYLQGLALGLAYVAPIGMQNLFVINSALTQTRLRALVTALIVIFFDVTLALACFFGIGLVMQKYPPVQLGILLLGGLVVVYIDVSLLKSSVRQIGGAQQMLLGKTVWAACVVTWFNAQAVIDGTMLLGAFKASMTEAQSLHFFVRRYLRLLPVVYKPGTYRVAGRQFNNPAHAKPHQQNLRNSNHHL